MMLVVPPASAGRGAAEEVVARHRAHEGQLHVGVRVDAAGHHVLAAGVEHVAPAGASRLSPTAAILAVLAQHVGAEVAVGVDDGAAADQDGVMSRS